jgi:hypothetical protein
MSNDILSEKLLANVIQQEMNLRNDQVYIYNQDFKIPNISDIFIVIEYIGDNPICNNNWIKETDTGFDEFQQCTVLEKYMVDIYSRNNEARLRKQEVVMALRSIYSEQIQEGACCKIFPVFQSFRNVSRAEGDAMLTRYAIDVYMQRQYVKTISHTDYLEGSGIDVYDAKHLEEGVPLIHLDINGV